MEKRRKSWFFAGLMVIFLVLATSCERNPLEKSPYQEADLNHLIGVTMNTDKKSYSVHPSEITITIKNESAAEYYYGVDFSVEKKEGDLWKVMPFKGEISWIELAVILQSQSENKENISFDLLRDQLGEGTYRIIKTISSNPVSAEFEIVEK